MTAELVLEDEQPKRWKRIALVVGGGVVVAVGGAVIVALIVEKAVVESARSYVDGHVAGMRTGYFGGYHDGLRDRYVGCVPAPPNVRIEA